MKQPDKDNKKKLFSRFQKNIEKSQAFTEEDMKKIGERNSPVEEQPKLGISDSLKELNDKFDTLTQKKKPKDKSFKLPFNVKSQLKTLARKRKILVFLACNNRNLEPKVCKITNDRIWINDGWHECSLDFVFLWKGKFPAIILPEWDLLPIGTKDYYDALNDGRNASAQQIIIKQIEANEVAGSKMNFSGKTMIWIFVIGVIVFYLLFGGGLQ